MRVTLSPSVRGTSATSLLATFTPRRVRVPTGPGQDPQAETGARVRLLQPQASRHVSSDCSSGPSRPGRGPTLPLSQPSTVIQPQIQAQDPQSSRRIRMEASPPEGRGEKSAWGGALKWGDPQEAPNPAALWSPGPEGRAAPFPPVKRGPQDTSPCAHTGPRHLPPAGACRRRPSVQVGGRGLRGEQLWALGGCKGRREPTGGAQADAPAQAAGAEGACVHTGLTYIWLFINTGDGR